MPRRDTAVPIIVLAGVLVIGSLVAGHSIQPASAAFAAITGFGQATGSSEWRWPTDPPWVLVRDFLAPRTPYAAGHRGIDLNAAIGAPVYSPAEGTVAFAGRVVDRSVLSIAHGRGLVSSFEPVAALVVAGQNVRAGERVGTVEAGSHCDFCVHFGLRLHGLYISPRMMIGGVPRAILLPLRPP